MKKLLKAFYSGIAITLIITTVIGLISGSFYLLHLASKVSLSFTLLVAFFLVIIMSTLIAYIDEN